ncbi:unnamed protein product [Ilex paraguariensis]|uniref:Uncharacterized protein n=1 Tax=Ilex paraguariensis TaxID=185542 RepID=A0ABC8RK87_9AQUA
MEKADEEKSDGLEIISVGTLYSGPWDKKYWSSSRGKDRYPYPVGYQALRTYSGTTYKMGILEGLKGPLFTISSTDGHSCSGQTPDIAWESFQKKGCPRMKLWHGKRFSCKIDGVEFFGFKNPFVRRLLRDLVANVSRTSEKSSLSPGICSGASTPKPCPPCTESYQYPDLLPYLEKPHFTGKRSRKSINVQSCSLTPLKRLRPPGQMHKADATNIGQGIQNDRNSSTFSTTKKEHGDCDGPGVLPGSINLETVVDEVNSSFVAEEGTHLDSFGSRDDPEVAILLPQEDSKLISSTTAEEAKNLSKDEKLVRVTLDRSKVNEMQGYSSLKLIEEKVEEKTVPIDSQKINNVDIRAPDTLDHQVDDASEIESSLNITEASPHNGKDELIASYMVVSEVLDSESHPEEIGTSSSNAGSEKSDFDSVGQEITKSMMTVLLPRALPLLKKFSRKKKITTNHSDSSIHRVRSPEENNGTDICLITSPAGTLTEDSNEERKKEKMLVQSTELVSVSTSCGHITAVVPDSLENDQCSYPMSIQLPLPDVSEADRTTIAQGTCSSENVRVPVTVDAQESSVSHAETCDSKLSASHEVHMASNERPQNAVVAEGNGANLLVMESSVQIPQKEVTVLAEGTSNGNTVSTKLPSVAASSSKSNAPLSESIICRNPETLCARETCVYSRTVLASDNCVVSLSGHCPIEKVPSGGNAMVHKQLHSSNTAKSCMNPEGATSNMAPITSHIQEFIWASNSNVSSGAPYPSISCIEKSQAYVGKGPLKHQHVVSYGSPISQLQNQGRSFFSNMTGNKELKDGPESSDFNMQPNTENKIDLEGIVQLLGCYVHSMPILFVVLCKKANEIYICVLCGLLVDKERTLFIYNAPTEGKSLGCPSLIGHASLMSPASRDDFDREIPLDESCLQFTPDGQYLVLLSSIKAPSCREGKLHCVCSACTSDCFEKNAVKIVQVKLGYVLVIAKLKTADVVRCILVCEPSCLLAAEESGRLHLWIMNSTWSAVTEECYLPTSDCMPPIIVELKRIPKCAALAVGHNGFGEFNIWDICKRILVSRFSASSTSFRQILPVSLFRWPRKGLLPPGPVSEEDINEIMEKTEMWFSEGGKYHVSLPIQGEDVAIWLLVLTALDPDVQHGSKLSGCQINPGGWWRLALLVKNNVILGSALDPRATAIGASAGDGIIGTCDGLVYMWELSTGTMLGNLHDFRGIRVSCIATDDSSSGAFAVAGDGGRLLVYSRPQRATANKRMNC